MLFARHFILILVRKSVADVVPLGRNRSKMNSTFFGLLNDWWGRRATTLHPHSSTRLMVSATVHVLWCGISLCRFGRLVWRTRKWKRRFERQWRYASTHVRKSCDDKWPHLYLAFEGQNWWASGWTFSRARAGKGDYFRYLELKKLQDLRQRIDKERNGTQAASNEGYKTRWLDLFGTTGSIFDHICEHMKKLEVMGYPGGIGSAQKGKMT